MPEITCLTPAAGPAAGGTPVVVSGEGFNLTSGVTVGGTPVTAQLTSDTEIHLVTPAHAPGVVQVVVTAANAQSAVTDASTFTFLPAPILESVVADSWERAKTRVTIRGANLAGTTSVTFKGIASLGFTVDAEGASITATRPPGPAGTTPVVVTTGGGASAPYLVRFLPDKTQLAIFITQIVYMVLLIGGLIAYVDWTGFRHGLPDPLTIVPLGVPWAGAMGAVTLSLSGLVYHRDDWNRSFIYWYLSRPILGMVIGTFAYLVVASGVLASGGTVTGAASNATGNVTGTAGFHVTNIFYYVLAFLVGYREETFRNLLQRFSDVLFGPGSTGETPATPPSSTP